MDNLSTLKDNLVRDLVQLEDNLDEQTLEHVEEVYQKVYDILTDLSRKE